MPNFRQIAIVIHSLMITILVALHHTMFTAFRNNIHIHSIKSSSSEKDNINFTYRSKVKLCFSLSLSHTQICTHRDTNYCLVD